MTYAILRDAAIWLARNPPPGSVRLIPSRYMLRGHALPVRRDMSQVKRGEFFDALVMHPETIAELDVRISFDRWMDRAELELGGRK
jgi:hypothetical protein